MKGFFWLFILACVLGGSLALHQGRVLQDKVREDAARIRAVMKNSNGVPPFVLIGKANKVAENAGLAWLGGWYFLGVAVVGSLLQCWRPTRV